MPQVIAGQLVALGLSKLVATVAAYAITAVATSFVSGLLQGGPPKADASERENRGPKPPRIHVLGARRAHGSSMLFTNTTESETVDVWAYCEGPINAVVQVYLNDDKVTIAGGFIQALSDGSYANNTVLAGYNLGPIPNVAHAPVVARVPAWTNEHRGDGIVSGYLIKTGVKSKNFLDIYPQGDNVPMSLVVEGHFCHDPRDPGSDPYDPATWPYTENAALHLLWFKSVFKEEDYAAKFAPTEQYWIDAADDCDLAMTLAAGGSEPKYRSCVMFPADADPSAIESELLGAFDGWVAPDENGCWKVYSGKLYTPTVTIGPDKIIDYELQEFVEDENRINEILVRHVSADHDYNEVEPEAWRDESDIEARGKAVSTTLNLQVPSHTQARRLAKRRMARDAAPQRGTVRVVFSARDALAERYINLVIEEAGVTFFSGTVEVLGGERDFETGGATIEWIAVDPNVDAWNPASEDGQPAPTAAKYYLEPLATPTINSATLVDGQAHIDATGPDRDDLTWYTRWRLDGSTAWTEQCTEDADAGAPVLLIIGVVPADTDIEIEVAYSVGDGRVSPWSSTASLGTGTPPAQPTNFSVTGGVGQADSEWINPTSPNFLTIKFYRNSANDFGTATLVATLPQPLGGVGTYTATGLSAGTHYFFITSNSSGDESAPVASGAITVT